MNFSSHKNHSFLCLPKKGGFPLLILVFFLGISCIPEYLKKYTGAPTDDTSELKPSSSEEADREDSRAALSQNDPFTQTNKQNPGELGVPDRSRDSGQERQGFFAPKASPRSALNSSTTLVKSAQIVVYKAGAKDVWEAALKVLLMNYNISLVDKELGVISTDWDNFYQGDRLLRNKVTLHIKKLNWGSSEVTINSSLEKYSVAVSDLNYNKEVTDNGLWLPDTDHGGESTRLFKNIARVLNLTEPNFPYTGPSVSTEQKQPDEVRLSPF